MGRFTLATEDCCFVGNAVFPSSDPAGALDSRAASFDLFLGGDTAYQSVSDRFLNHQNMSVLTDGGARAVFIDSVFVDGANFFIAGHSCNRPDYAVAHSAFAVPANALSGSSVVFSPPSARALSVSVEPDVSQDAPPPIPTRIPAATPLGRTFVTLPSPPTRLSVPPYAVHGTAAFLPSRPFSWSATLAMSRVFTATGDLPPKQVLSLRTETPSPLETPSPIETPSASVTPPPTESDFVPAAHLTQSWIATVSVSVTVSFMQSVLRSFIEEAATRFVSIFVSLPGGSLSVIISVTAELTLVERTFITVIMSNMPMYVTVSRLVAIRVHVPTTETVGGMSNSVLIGLVAGIGGAVLLLVAGVIAVVRARAALAVSTSTSDGMPETTVGSLSAMAQTTEVATNVALRVFGELFSGSVLDTIELGEEDLDDDDIWV
jgi:hypothetical protein